MRMTDRQVCCFRSSCRCDERCSLPECAVAVVITIGVAIIAAEWGREDLGEYIFRG